jgi:hypothetical protein
VSASWIEPLVRYRRSRLPAAPNLGLALFLGIAAGVAGRPASAAGLAWMGALAAALILQFRLWDDLSDREHDRRTHPERVLPRARSLAPFQALLGAAAGLSLLLLGTAPADGARLTAFLALSGGLLAWYRWRPSAGPTLGGAHLTLARYPVFVYLLTGAGRELDTPRLLLAMGAVYLSFGTYELLHDRALRAAARARALLALELAVLTALPAVAALVLGTPGRPPWLLAAVATASGGMLAARVLRRGAPLDAGRRAYAAFAVGLLVILTFSPGGAP